jgi:hypothetical protein
VQRDDMHKIAITFKPVPCIGTGSRGLLVGQNDVTNFSIEAVKENQLLVQYQILNSINQSLNRP